VQELTVFFVKDIMRRSMTPADWRGRHAKAAKRLLTEMKYDRRDVMGALYSLRDREYSHFGFESESQLPNNIQGMEILYLWGEPPLIERWLTPPEAPPVYSCDYDKWVQKWGKRAIQRKLWDGIYLRQNPQLVEEWLKPVVGDEKYRMSVAIWQTLQETPQRKKR